MEAMGTACQEGARQFPDEPMAVLSSGARADASRGAKADASDGPKPMYLAARSALCSEVGHALIVEWA